MSGLSHLAGGRGRGRGRASQQNQRPRSSQLQVPRGRSSRRPTPAATASCSTPKWGPADTAAVNGGGARGGAGAGRVVELPKYQIPAGLQLDSSDEEEEVDNQVLEKVTRSYGEDSAEIRSRLADLYSSSSNSCLICISTVRHIEAVWSCPTCSDSFHLVCIQKWARDGVKPPSGLSQELFPEQEVPWHCPKCRQEFSKAKIPSRYYCYCGKEQDPRSDPWVAPHSCGAVCGRQLSSKCGHSCLLLCHPGRCPPCPKQVISSCYCGSRRNVTRRCGQARWSCGDTCNKLLQCGDHPCTQPCHEGECPPCDSSSSQSCRCGRDTALRPCLKWDWQCVRVCGRRLPCGDHTCMEVCHPPGECMPCPQSLRTTCPCGKTPLSGDYPCNMELPVCGSSCDKPLPCGAHSCFKLCHAGACDTCLQVRDKTCRCGRTHKVVPCSQDLTCEVKCNRPKECTRHSCKKKCCPGRDCTTCDKKCDRTLPCRNHKCAGVCHPGRCYPCPEKVDVTCACAHARITVACGRERSTRPPKCKRSCNAPTDCHHEKRESHRCHYKSCPPCKQECGMGMKGCAHICTVPCHDKVLIKPKGPGDPKIIKKPCPPCQVLVEMECLGGHEISTVKCSELAPYSCRGPCGRLLPCGNHTCSKECHSTNQPCEECEEMCGRARACAHTCTRPCHVDQCQPCRQYLRLPCHCGILHLSVKCTLFTAKAGLEELLSCGSKCIKRLECGHSCRKTCHLGACSERSACKNKVATHCKCGKLRRDVKCGEAFRDKDKLALACQDSCKQQKDDAPMNSSNKQPAHAAEEAESRGVRRRWRGKDKSLVEEPPSFLARNSSKLTAFVALLVAAAGIYFCTLD